jgi:hypothetical protein
MHPEDREVLDSIKQQYQAGELRHLTLRDIYDVAVKYANYPGKYRTFQDYMASRT